MQIIKQYFIRWRRPLRPSSRWYKGCTSLSKVTYGGPRSQGISSLTINYAVGKMYPCLPADHFDKEIISSPVNQSSWGAGRLVPPKITFWHWPAKQNHREEDSIRILPWNLPCLISLGWQKSPVGQEYWLVWNYCSEDRNLGLLNPRLLG